MSLQPFVTSDLPLRRGGVGKVREWYELRPGERAIVVTDRISAFDRILGAIPYKGQVLNQLSAFWFERTADIVPNHLLRVPDPNVSIVRVCRPIPLEIVVRGYITGVTSTSLWTLYARGERELYGVRLPEGLRKNDPLPQPIVTPTTKATHGHDERITRETIIARGILTAEQYAQIEAIALALFARGTAVCAQQGITLVDTKYEFGWLDGTLMLIDELHTPDSSRFWLHPPAHPDESPEHLDKEFIRLWYVAQGYRGESEPPPMDDALIAEASRRYILAYERITGQMFQPAPYPVNDRLRAQYLTW